MTHRSTQCERATPRRAADPSLGPCDARPAADAPARTGGPGCRAPITPPRAPGHRGPRRGFTIAELLVAVTVVIVLSLAIGQVFSSVGKLVGAGAAISEVDQLARAVERQMREDFDAFSRLRADETFFAIRSRTLGDANNNGTVETANGEISLYLNQDDKDRDVRAGYASAYQRDADGNQIARGVTARLDEMVFLSRASERARFVSAQINAAEGDPVTTDVARIYYGHGLLPAPAKRPDGADFDPTQPLDIDNRPVRRLFPDTYKVATPNDPDDDASDLPSQRELNWGDVFGEPLTRNEFASNFPLLRQPLLLYGGTAAGILTDRNGDPQSPITAPFNRRRTYAPYIRDLETLHRNNANVNANRGRFVLSNGWFYPANTRASARMLRWGRTDICAMDRDDVQRWLEGLETSDQFRLTDPEFDPAEASAFRAGVFDDSVYDDEDPAAAPLLWKRAGADFVAPDAALMYRLPPAWGTRGSPNVAPDLTPQQAVLIASTRLRSAIAGVFTRMLCEPAPTQVPTRVNPIAGTSERGPIGTVLDPFPADAAMDQHAVLAPRCSNFEIAWSDGTTWASDTPLRVYLGPAGAPGPGRRELAEYRRGDLVWFDSVFTRSHYAAVARDIGLPLADDPNPLTAAPNPEVRGEITDLSVFAKVAGASTASHPTSPAAPAEDRTSADDTLRLINVSDERYEVPADRADFGWYDPYRSGGNPREYLAIWGFRRPAVRVESLGPLASDQRMTLGWSNAAWEKPKFIRVRMTLHDALNRIAQGKNYEFVFKIEPSAN